MSTSNLSVLYLRNVFVICFTILEIELLRSRKMDFQCLGEPEINYGQVKLDCFL